jgi:hypothetical protein
MRIINGNMPRHAFVLERQRPLFECKQSFRGRQTDAERHSLSPWKAETGIFYTRLAEFALARSNAAFRARPSLPTLFAPGGDGYNRSPNV